MDDRETRIVENGGEQLQNNKFYLKKWGNAAGKLKQLDRRMTFGE